MPIVSAPRVIAGGRVLVPGAVVVEDDRIAAVLDHRPASAPDHLALDQGVLAPGLIDVQLNGAFGVDLVDAELQDWDRVVRRLPSTGVTGFLATFISAPTGDLIAAMARAAAARTACQGRPGARILGVHLEGPFLSPRRRGAHDAAHLIDPTADQVDRLLDAGAGILSMLTLAPEREGALEATKRLAGAGVLVSVGHSDAVAEQVSAAVDAGARMVTHVFNAQRGLHHREPGVAGQALAAPRCAPTAPWPGPRCGWARPSATWSASASPRSGLSRPPPRCLPTSSAATTSGASSPAPAPTWRGSPTGGGRSPPGSTAS